MWPFTADKTKGYNYITKGNGLIKKDVMDMWFKVIAAMLPAAIVGIPFDNYFEKHFHNWQVVSAALIAYGVLFIVIEKINKNRKPKGNKHNRVYNLLQEAAFRRFPYSGHFSQRLNHFGRYDSRRFARCGG